MQLLKTAEIYLDNNATTKALPEVALAVVSAISDNFGNPSSVHTAGDRSREVIRTARENIGNLLSCDPTKVLFTGSGTESNNIVLSSAASWSKRKPRILTTTVEHSSILAMCDHLKTKDVDIVLLSVDENGSLDLRMVESALEDEISLVSIQWVNNETGVIQPIEEIGSLCRKAGVPFHTDAAQAVGKLEINLSAAPIDYLSFTGHKLHAPQGIGVLYARDIQKLHPLMFGGSQENGLRPGTENLAGIAGIGCAAAIRKKQFSRSVIQLEAMRETFEKCLIASIPDIRINGGGVPRACNTTNVLFDGLNGQALTIRLDQAGIRCSQSSACTNQRPEPSYVLRSMGLSEDQAYGSIRFSFSVLNTADEVESSVGIIAELCKKLRAFGV